VSPVLEELERTQVLERAEKVDSTVEFNVPEMEVHSWTERERSEFELHTEHLKITGRILKNRFSDLLQLDFDILPTFFI
jgi:hypothetical protein